MKRRWWVPYAFLALPLTMYVIWVIIPIFQTFVFSFTDWDGVSPTYHFIGFENYKEIFSDPYFMLSLKNNIKWLLAFVLLSVPAGLGVAILLDQKFPGGKVYKTMMYLPMTLSFVVIGQIWSWILEPKYGALNTFLRAIGLSNLAKPWLSDPGVVTYALIAAASWRQIAYAMVLFLAGLKNVPRDLVEAAYVDGANSWQRFWYIILPLLRPAMVIAITVSVIDSLRAFDIVYVLTRGGPFYSSSVLANYMYIQSFHNYRMGFGASIAVVQFLITFGFILLYLLNVFKREEKF
ncbi:MAG TPA: sugar ABC transporter permease [Thermotoga sp.]|nr:sugar ABC transporter permease [Thermotoga sp.]